MHATNVFSNHQSHSKTHCIECCQFMNACWMENILAKRHPQHHSTHGSMHAPPCRLKPYLSCRLKPYLLRGLLQPTAAQSNTSYMTCSVASVAGATQVNTALNITCADPAGVGGEVAGWNVC